MSILHQYNRSLVSCACVRLAVYVRGRVLLVVWMPPHLAVCNSIKSRGQRNSCAPLSIVALQGGICSTTTSERVGALQAPLFVRSMSWVIMGMCAPAADGTGTLHRPHELVAGANSATLAIE